MVFLFRWYKVVVFFFWRSSWVLRGGREIGKYFLIVRGKESGFYVTVRADFNNDVE